MEKRIVIYFALLCLIIKDSQGEQLLCDYIRHSDGYNCEMKSTFLENKEVTSVTGEHKFGKNNSDVEVFFVTDSSNSKYVPSKVCSVFEKLTKFDVYGTSIIELKKNIFEGCTELKKIVIKYVKLKELEEDLFSEVTTLESFVLGFTSVEVLPKKLFANNPNLKYLDLSFNKLRTITTEFPNNLVLLSLMNNECIDSHFDSRSFASVTSLEKVIQETYKKCSPTDTNANSSNITYDNVQMRLMEEQINANENKLSTIESDLETIETKLSNKIEDNLKTFKAFKLDITEKLTSINNDIEKVQKSSNDQNEKFYAATNQLQDDSRNMKIKLAKNEELKQMTGRLRSEINRNENLLVTLFCFQLVMIIIAVVFMVYKKFYSNRNFGVRLVNDQTQNL